MFVGEKSRSNLYREASRGRGCAIMGNGKLQILTSKRENWGDEEELVKEW